MDNLLLLDSGDQPARAPGAGHFCQSLAKYSLTGCRVAQGGRAQGGVTGPQQPHPGSWAVIIIADERSNSLLIYATPQDMDTITNIVEKLDVLLAQVLIETVIMEVDLNKQWNYGISVAQNPASKGNVSTVGAINNGQPFYNFLNSVSSNTWPGNFVSTAPAGLSYFGSIGENWDLALQAAASDSSTHIIQRPRIQTSQAKEAQFFVGQSVPYVTSVYYDSGFNSGPSSSYSQLQSRYFLGRDSFLLIQMAWCGDGHQPANQRYQWFYYNYRRRQRTEHRQPDIYFRSCRERSRHHYPGRLYGHGNCEIQHGCSYPARHSASRRIYSDRLPATKRGMSCWVLMRPTVLKTPELAAIQAVKEEVRLPGISAAEREERAVATQERKAEDAKEKSGGQFMVEPSVDATYTNSIQVNPNAR